MGVARLARQEVPGLDRLGTPRQDRDPVPALLSASHRAISCRLDRGRGKPVVGGLQLLQAGDVRRALLEPSQQHGQPPDDAVDVERGNLHVRPLADARDRSSELGSAVATPPLGASPAVPDRSPGPAGVSRRAEWLGCPEIRRMAYSPSSEPLHLGSVQEALPVSTARRQHPPTGPTSTRPSSYARARSHPICASRGGVERGGAALGRQGWSLPAD